MRGPRSVKLMHDGPDVGRVLFAFPLTTDIAASLRIASQKTGLLVGLEFDDPRIADQFEAGELNGLSIGGDRIRDRKIA